MNDRFSIDATESARLCSLHSYEVFGEVVTSIANSDDSLTVVVSDYGRRLSLERLREAHPSSYVQVGIAEQDQVSVASAMALEGFHVIAPCYASFITGRAFDQVRVNLGIMSAPVVLVGIAAGYDSGDLGASHMSTEDVALMRSIPGMTVISPADNAELACALRELVAHPTPAYVRVTGAAANSNLHPDGCSAPIARAEELRVGSDVAILACGQVSAAALEAADILASRGISASVSEMAVLNPFGDDDLITSVETYPLVVTVEEHSRKGGLGSAVAEALSGRANTPALLRLGTPERYVDGDVRDKLLAQARLDAEGIAGSVSARLADLSLH